MYQILLFWWNRCCSTNLIEQIVQTFIQVLKVQQNHCAPCLHANFDLVDVTTHLQEFRDNNSHIENNVIQAHCSVQVN